MTMCEVNILPAISSHWSYNHGRLYANTPPFFLLKEKEGCETGEIVQMAVVAMILL